MNISGALKALGSAGDKLPEEALRWSLDNWDAASGAFMQVLARCARELENATDADVNVALFGLHLMAEKRETRAFPLMCALAKSPEGLFAILGDTMLWSGASIFISLFDGDADGLRAIVESPDVDPMLKSCAFEAIAYLTATRAIPRDETRAFLARLHGRANLYPDDEPLWDSWAMAVAMLGFDDLMPFARPLLTLHAENPDEVDLSDLDRLLQMAKEDPSGLGAFTDETIRPMGSAIATLRRIDKEAMESPGEEDLDDREALTPVENPNRKVGRNDTCPCGSGKKYKKCCLAA